MTKTREVNESAARNAPHVQNAMRVNEALTRLRSDLILASTEGQSADHRLQMENVAVMLGDAQKLLMDATRTEFRFLAGLTP